MRSILSKSQKKLYDQSKKIVINKQNWSDGIVYYTPLAHNNIHVKMNSIYYMLTAFGTLCFLGLAKKVPLRGGIDIGWGVELRRNEIYGCAVARAYQLEKHIAKYPRIVLGDNLIDYIREQANLVPKTFFDKLNNKLAQLCLDFIIFDVDNKAIIHYLGKNFSNSITLNQHKLLYEHANKFIVESLNHFQKESNLELIMRYKCLLDYFVHHKPN